LHSIDSTFYFGAFFTEQYFTGFYTYFLLIFTIHTIKIMSQHHEQQQERSRLKNQTKALYQAQVFLRFIGVEARARAEGITVINRMVDQAQHFDECSVVNNRQTGEMK